MAKHDPAQHAAEATPRPIDDLVSVASDIFDRWDKDMRSGKLLVALEGRVADYDPRVSRVRKALDAHDELMLALQVIATLPMPKGGDAFYRIANGKFAIVGHTEWMRS